MIPLWLEHLTKATAHRSFEWHVDYYDGRKVMGWVGCRKAPRTPCLIAFHQGDELLVSAIADQPRPDVAALGYEPAGFSCNFDHYVDGAVTMHASNAAALLRWRSLHSQMVPGLGCGFVESLSVSRIRGWCAAMPKFDTQTPPEIALWQGHRKIAKTMATHPRTDVAAKIGVDDPCAGFDLALPLDAIVYNKGKDSFTLRAHYGERSFVIKDNINFAGASPGFERSLTYYPDSHEWV